MYKFISVIILFIILLGCGNTTGHNQIETDKKESIISPKSGERYELKEAVKKGFIQVSANGLGTFRKIQVDIQNKSETNINLILPAGIYFKNPDHKSQSLITGRKEGLVLLTKDEKIQVEIPSYCTNVNQSIPSNQPNWEYIENYDGGLDEVIEFYGSHEKEINRWLIKKNVKFSKEENRLLFFQTVIWFHEGGQHAAILNMLKNEVFNGDLNQAKLWLDEVVNDAKEMADLVRNKDNNELKQWLKKKMTQMLPTEKQVDRAVNRGKERLLNLRRQLNK
jgi:polyhydroxyalkanoate synthesis regulator phasin